MSLQKHLKMLLRLFAVTIIWLFFLLLLFDSINRVVIFIIALYLLIYALPVIIIHLNYYKHSQGNIFEISKSIIIKKTNDEILRIDASDINKISLYMTANQIKNSGLRHFPFESYYYARIELLNGKEEFITCLFSANLENILKVNFKDLQIEKIKKFYPLI